jgi:ubiquinone/menaquinone biosynthesis C-methylase UbiE
LKPSFPDSEKTEREFFNRFANFHGRRILEIGCGDGRTLSYYTDQAKWIVGMDNDRDELTVARKTFGNVPFICGDAAILPFADSSFDLTILSWSL